MKARAFIRSHAPQPVLQGYRALRGRETRRDSAGQGLSLTGDYGSWDEASADSTGYDTEIILERTKDALLRVKNGQAVYERDSVLFGEIHYAWPLLAGLMWVAARSDGTLNVLDFGGSLGSTYFQNREFLSGLREVRWNIVEQSRHVEVGKSLFEDERLRFYHSLEDCLAETQPQAVVLSGVLQFMPDPYGMLNDLLGLDCGHLLVDRTPFWDGPEDRLCIEHVPKEIYPASYPSWIFSTELFRSHIEQNWVVVADFEGFDKFPGPVPCTFRGMIARRREPR